MAIVSNFGKPCGASDPTRANPVVYLLRCSNRISNHKPPINIPPAPKIEGRAIVAVLAARGRCKPSHRGADHEGGADHESQNDGAPSCLSDGVARLGDNLRNTALRLSRGKSSADLDQANEISPVLRRHGTVTEA